MNWVRIAELVRKEFIILFRDSRNRRVLIIAPIIQILVFGYVVNYDIRDVRVAVMDQDRTRDSRALVEAFEGGGIFRVTHYPQTQDELEGLLLDGRVDLALKIPPNASARMRQGETAPVQILADGRMSNMASVRISYTMFMLDRFNRQMIRELKGVDLDYGSIDARIRTWYNPNMDSQNFFVPAIVAFVVMLISLLLTSIAVIREREQGTMEQLVVSPIRPAELICGKTIPYIVISVVQMVGITILAKYWFSVPIAGSLALMFAATCVFLLSTLGVGLFISTVSSTQQQAMMTTFFFILPFFMLSGFVFPIANMPVVVQWLTYLNPLRYFLVILRGIFLKGVGFEVLWPQFLGLAILGALLFAGAVSRFSKRLD
ncbi:MAG TPA: ABC transporter permease [Deltaproteobacteria bacterium]|nr:ABC transporter permease [Deltaproteobacteria bacterium]HOI05629.1 ABC transporter permease [Deltaproteobacteria bacterium]